MYVLNGQVPDGQIPVVWHYWQYHNGQVLNGQVLNGQALFYISGNIYQTFCSNGKIWLGIWPMPSQTCPPNLNLPTADNAGWHWPVGFLTLSTTIFLIIFID